MSILRSLASLKLSASRDREPDMMPSNSPYHFAPPRDSPTATSSASSPITPTFSFRSHGRCPSSASSLASNPDLSSTSQKTALHDVVEDPEERDDFASDSSLSAVDEPLCICDTPFCHHRQTSLSRSVISPIATPEWTPGDDYFSDGQASEERLSKRPRSGEFPGDSIASRLSRRFTSMSRPWQRQRSSSSVSVAQSTTASAPPSRTSSLRLPSLRSSMTPTISANRVVSTPVTPMKSDSEVHMLGAPRAASHPRTKPIDIQVPTPEYDPVDRHESVSTPLLPPMLADLPNRSDDDLQSPLQSPSVAAPSAAASLFGTPRMTPLHNGMPTPPLSSKASSTSLALGRPALPPTSEIPPLAISEDPWAAKLGHANFHIQPEPYMPTICDVQACVRLRDAWEAARISFIRHAAWINENYGPTSQIFKLTEQKWAEIDARWRANYEKVNAEAQISAQSPQFQPLAETQAVASMPVLSDPQQPDKFPAVDEADIVGPMVQYARIPQSVSRRPAILKLFTDPSSLLGGRRAFGLRK